MRLKRVDPVGIGDLGVSRPIDHVKGIDGGAGLGADARKGDGNAFAIQAGENVVKQAESISGLDLDQRVSRVRSVIDGNGKPHSIQNLAAGGLTVPQFGQTSKRWPHSRQNLALGGLRV